MGFAVSCYWYYHVCDILSVCWWRLWLVIGSQGQCLDWPSVHRFRRWPMILDKSTTIGNTKEGGSCYPHNWTSPQNMWGTIGQKLINPLMLVWFLSITRNNNLSSKSGLLLWDSAQKARVFQITKISYCAAPVLGKHSRLYFTSRLCPRHTLSNEKAQLHRSVEEKDCEEQNENLKTNKRTNGWIQACFQKLWSLKERKTQSTLIDDDDHVHF